MRTWPTSWQDVAMRSIDDDIPELTPEEIAAGATMVRIPPSEMTVVDASDQHVERMARGFILGTRTVARRKDIRDKLEEKVTKRIGHKGKYLVDKLFELIEGVQIVQKEGTHEVRYYKVPPNLNAIIYALDRVLGKPKQVSEHSEEKKGIILVEHVIRNLAGQPYVKNGVGKNIVGRGSLDGIRGGGNGNAGVAAGDGAVVEQREPKGAGAQPV